MPRVRARLKGNNILVRYADDSVMAFEILECAKRVMDVPGKRLARYGLTLQRFERMDAQPVLWRPRPRYRGPKISSLGRQRPTELR